MKLLTIALLVLSVNIQAQDWKELYKDGDATKVGAIYAATCNVCNTHGRFNNDNGLWVCTNDSLTPSPIYRDCKAAIVAAIKGKYTGE